jgi:hypothetical protein
MNSRYLLFLALAIVGLAGAWLFAGRQFVLVLDQISTTGIQPLPTGPFVYASGIKVGDYTLETLLPDGQRAGFHVDVDASGWLVLHAGGKSFLLGARTGPPSKSGWPDIPFAPDPGDEVAFGLERSLLGWPTPFELNFMTGHSPRWRRNMYFRLAWRKPSGAALDMVWRYEQGYDSDNGWTSAWTTRDGATGLIHVGIVEAAAPNAESIDAYLMRTKNWTRDDYRLESRGMSADGCCAVVRVIHRSDDAAAQPGGGRSIELHINRATRGIDRALSLQ